MTQEQVNDALKLLKQGYTPLEVAQKYGVSRSVIYRRIKYPDVAKDIPIATKNKVIKAIKEGHTKAEAAQMYGLNIGTVMNFTRNLEGYRSQGNHIIRKNGVQLLNRLMNDGYLISDFNVPVVRNLPQKFPIIRSARYKDKTFFYLPGREEQTIEAFFREKPNRIISYSAIEEMSYILGVKISNKNQYNFLERFKKKHEDYWESRRFIQRCLDDWSDEPQSSKISFRLFPKQQE